MIATDVLQSMLPHPDSDWDEWFATTRLVLADYLEENGDKRNVLLRTLQAYAQHSVISGSISELRLITRETVPVEVVICRERVSWQMPGHGERLWRDMLGCHQDVWPNLRDNTLSPGFLIRATPLEPGDWFLAIHTDFWTPGELKAVYLGNEEAAKLTRQRVLDVFPELRKKSH